MTTNTEEIIIAREGSTSSPVKRFVRNKDAPPEKELMRERMVSARVMNGMTAVEAAQRLGYANSTQLSQIESGERKVPGDWQFLLRMSKVYMVSMDYLMGISPHPERDAVASESFAMLRGFESLMEAQALSMTAAFVRYGTEREAARTDLQAVTAAAGKVSAALTRMRELCPAFDEELRGGNTLIRAVEQLETAVLPLGAAITRRVAAEQHCLAIARGKEGPLSPLVAQMSLGLDA